MTDQIRDEQGRFTGKHPESGDDFDSESGSELANEHSWEYHRDRILEEYDLPEEWVDE